MRIRIQGNVSAKNIRLSIPSVKLLNNAKLAQNGLKRLNKENETETEPLKLLNIDKRA
jgi:hypothetical protein